MFLFRRQRQGRIQWFRLESGKGEIIPDGGGALPFHIYAPQMDFEVGDVVTYEREGANAERVRFIRRTDLKYDVFWCPHCRAHRRYHEVKEVVHDGDWGAYNERLCLICGRKVEGYGFGGMVLGRLIDQYMKGELPPDAAGFADAVRANRGSAITEFLEGYLKIRR